MKGRWKLLLFAGAGLSATAGLFVVMTQAPQVDAPREGSPAEAMEANSDNRLRAFGEIERAVDLAFSREPESEPAVAAAEVERPATAGGGTYAALSERDDEWRRIGITDWAENLAEFEPHRGLDALLEIANSKHPKRNSDAHAFVEAFSASVALFHPEAAWRWLESLPALYREHATRSVTRTWASIDPLATLGFVASLEDSSLRLAGIWALHQAQAEGVDVAFSRQFVAALAGDSEAERFTAALAYHWGRADSLGAAEWLLAMENIEARDIGWDALVRSIGQMDIESAKSLALRAPVEARRPALIAEVATVWGRERPWEAMNWVVEQGSDEAVMISAANLLPRWFAEDATAARHWLATADLSPSSREFLERFGGGSPSPR